VPGPWICCQLGAREHYAVPRVLHRNSLLAALYTDFWADSVVRKLAAGIPVKPLRSLATRFHPELAEAPVVSWNARSLFLELKFRRLAKHDSSSDRFSGYIKVGRDFASAVRNSLRQRQGLSSDTIFFAYDTGALEAMEWCREQGIKCILNQMDPNRVEVELVREEEKRWPGWATRALQVPEEYFRRREQEWALADRVVVNSEFCRHALMKQGVSSEKLVIMPLAYEEDAEKLKAETLKFKRPKYQNTETPLRVLFLGQVILRKGIQYLIEAARKLKGENIRFEIVGPIGISRDAIASAPRNMTFHGRASRNQAARWYRQADVFVLPTLSDGFAITQLEAMAHGLPVVTTPCCGEVVSDGVDGFIIPARESDALAKTFLRYLKEPDLLRSQRQAALVKSKQFNMDRLAENILRLETDLK
jgi:glycosyltransferase involved in cell wall biosynthesis